MLQDLRHALRLLRRAPGFALAAAVTLALGIGANTAIFTWVNAELLQALPYDHPGQLLVLNERANGRTVSDTYPDFLDWQRQNRASGGAFAGMAWFQQRGFNLSGAGLPEQVNAADVSANFFTSLGVRPQLGRDFALDADSAATAPAAILSEALWQRQFGGSPEAIGKVVNLDQRAYTVIGVLPARFRDYNQTDVFVPVGRFLKDVSDRGAHDDAEVIARLAPGATEAGARGQMEAAMASLARAYPATNAAEGAVVRPIRELFVGNDAGMLWLLLGAVGLVLLIACANIANLMLVRTAARGQEWTIRVALGAGRARLVRQLLLESVVVAGLGGLLGLGLAAAALRGLRPLASAATLRMNGPVLAFTAAVALLAAVLFGLAPARQAVRTRCALSARGASPRRSGHALVVAEVALALMLAAAAGLMLKSFSRLMAVNPGFRPQQVLTWGASLVGPCYQTPAALLGYERQALARLAALPGVAASGLGTNLPLSGNHSRADVTIAGRPLPAQGHFPHPDLHKISSGYLAALGVPLLRGRDFNAGDGPTAARVVLVNAQFAGRYWPGQDALGQQIWLGHPSPTGKIATVVGVVGDTKQDGLDAATRLDVYLPYQQSPPDTPQFVVRTALPPLSLVAAVRAELAGLDSTAPLVGMETMNQMVEASVANPHATLWLLGIFGGLALLLSAIGIYGVVSYSTQQRTQEIGVRMALGADRAAIARLIGGESLRLIGGGIALGLAGALAVGHFLASLLFGVTPTDIRVLLGVTSLLLGVGLLASALPIHRATRLAPWRALRRE